MAPVERHHAAAVSHRANGYEGICHAELQVGVSAKKLSCTTDVIFSAVELHSAAVEAVEERFNCARAGAALREMADLAQNSRGNQGRSWFILHDRQHSFVRRRSRIE
jgi:hypothetical protein